MSLIYLNAMGSGSKLKDSKLNGQSKNKQKLAWN